MLLFIILDIIIIVMWHKMWVQRSTKPLIWLINGVLNLMGQIKKF